MDSAAAALLDRLQSSDATGLYNEFSSYLLPFGDLIPLDSHNPTTTAAARGRGRTKAAAAKKRSTQRKADPVSDPKQVRLLGKQFLQFLCQTLRSLSLLLRRSSTEVTEVSTDAATELLAIYALAVDCLWCIAPSLDGKPATVLLHHCRLLRYLELWGRYAKVEDEAVAILASVRSLHKGEAADPSCFLPDPELLGGDADPAIGAIAVEVLTTLTGSTAKGKKRDAAAYERILALLDQVRPWLRLLDQETKEKNHSQLVNALYRGAMFLTGECMSFDGDLVRRFCSAMSKECVKSSYYVDRFPSIARKICSAAPSNWESRPLLLLDMLRITLDSIVCGCKGDLVKAIDEHLEFVLYCANSFCTASMDICRDASVLLHKRGGDIIEISPPIASMLVLYTTGLFLTSNRSPNRNDASLTMSLVDNEEKMQSLTSSLHNLARYFHIVRGNPLLGCEEKGSRVSVDLKPKKQFACKRKHGNASWLSYLDALEFLCKLLVEYVNKTWKQLVSEKDAIHSANISYLHDVLHQFCDFCLAAFRSTKTSDRDRDRLHEGCKTLLHAALSDLKISLCVGGNYQKSLLIVDCIISSEWIGPQEIKFLIASLNNIGAFLYDAGDRKQASATLELCCKGIWTHAKVLLRMYLDKSKGTYDVDLSEDVIRSAIEEAYTKTALILDVLHKCPTTNVLDIAIKSLFELSAVGDHIQNSSSSLPLVKQWVKILCKEYENIDAVGNVPVLYMLLSTYHSTWPKKLLGNILEQELLAYEMMKFRNPVLCDKMLIKVIDILLKDVYTAKNFNMQRSRVLVKKARVLRACGITGLSGCMECLSEAISLLNNVSDVPSADVALAHHQLALTYCLHAQCAQEFNQDREVILQDIQSALHLWSSIDIRGCSLQDGHHEFTSERTLPLLCNIVDLLSLKGCLKFQFEICKLIIIFCKQGNIPVEKCLAMLWTGQRLNHALCISPIDGEFIPKISKSLDIHANSIEYWASCMEDPPSLLMFLQKLLLCDSVLTEVSCSRSFRYFGSNISTDEVEKVATSLLSDVPLSSKPAFIAGYLYYDLSERLFSNGEVTKALSHAREALRLRKKVLQRKFSYHSEQKHETFGKPIKLNQKKHDFIYLEAIGSAITEVWPDVSESTNLEDSVLSPWNVLKCCLDSILQVGILHESTGNGIEAECFFQTGKEISHLQGLPIYGIAFTSLLGQLYRKKDFLDLAEDELNNARKLLVDDTTISCKCCKLAFEVNIDMQFGDLSRRRFEKGLQLESASAESLSVALCLYRSALEKLNHADVNGSNICDRTETSTECFTKNNGQAGYRDLDFCDLQLSENGKVLPECRACTYLNSSCSAPDQQKEKKNGKLSLDTEGTESHTKMEAKKRTKNTLKSLVKEHTSQPELGPRRTRSSNRTCRNSNAIIAEQVGENCGRSATNKQCFDSLERPLTKLNGISPPDFRCKQEYTRDRVRCWRCLLIRVMDSGSMKNILSLKWECQRRRLLLKLLVKTARSLVANRENQGAHEVHDVFWQCISVLYNGKLISQSYNGILNSYFIELIGDEILGDIFSIERAKVLYSFSLFSLGGCLSDISRITCCRFSNIKISNVMCWLLRAFILCRDFPVLFQKVSKLLAFTIIISTMCSPASFPILSGKSLSLGHWAAFFHQASLGTYLNSELPSRARDEACSTKASEGPFISSMVDTKESNILRFAPEKVEQLEEFVRGFFQDLPSVPIVCISMLGGDYVNLFGDILLLSSLFPAWLLLTRLDGVNQPIVMFLPSDFISEELEDADTGEDLILANKGSTNGWKCPWGYTVIDYIAPSFKVLLEENCSSLTNTSPSSADDPEIRIRWWSHRTRLNVRLDNFLRNVEDSWLGPWRCLLLGPHSNSEHLDMIVPKLVNDLKCQCDSEVNKNLVKSILNGAKSVADAEACISQLILYSGYFGRGSCCGEEGLGDLFPTSQKGNTTSAAKHVAESTRTLLLEAIGEPPESVDREPIILVLDSDVQMLPWENIPVLRSQEVYRMPSIASISITLNRNYISHDRDKTIGAIFPTIDPFDAYYLLNPSGDLNQTQVEFEQWFRNQKWEGKSGIVPTTEELALALRSHDLFLYFGHGSGTQYISGHEIQKLDHCPATLLMGCSSGSLLQRGCYAPQGTPLFYLSAGSPAVIANLWDVTDRDIDRFAKAMLGSWLQELSHNCTSCDQLVKEFECVRIEEGKNTASIKNRRKHSRVKKSQQSCDKGKCRDCGENRIASFMSQSRSACKLPLLIGAAPVCYGVPTVMRKKS